VFDYCGSTVGKSGQTPSAAERDLDLRIPMPALKATVRDIQSLVFKNKDKEDGTRESEAR
jgi:hypothetical protein